MLFSFWKIFYDSLAWHWNRDLNIYFQFQKNPSLITSQKLNICIAAKMKHSPNITEIKTWNFLRNTRSRGFKRDFIISLEFWKFWNIIKYSFANFLEITNGKLCFLQRGRGNLAKIKIWEKSTGINNINIKDKEYINSSI